MDGCKHAIWDILYIYIYIYIYKSTTTSRMFQYSKCDPMLTTKILLLTRVILKTFQKKNEDSSLCYASLFGHALLHFVMLLLTYSAPRTRISALQLFPHVLGQKVKFTIHLSLFIVTIHCHYSPVTIHDTVHSEFLPIEGGLSLIFQASFWCA